MSTVTRASERRVVLHDVSWATFQALSKEARGGRLAYDRGRLEIMSPSYEHENVKRLIGRLIEVFTEELGIDVASAGSTTFSREDLDRGIESDECYYIAQATAVMGKDDIELPRDPPPDLAIEVHISRSSLDKLGIYAALGIREVWRCDGATVAVHVLQQDQQYAVWKTSAVLPQFPIEEANRLLQARGSQSDTQIARDFRKWIRDRQ